VKRLRNYVILWWGLGYFHRIEKIPPVFAKLFRPLNILKKTASPRIPFAIIGKKRYSEKEYVVIRLGDFQKLLALKLDGIPIEEKIPFKDWTSVFSIGDYGVWEKEQREAEISWRQSVNWSENIIDLPEFLKD